MIRLGVAIGLPIVSLCFSILQTYFLQTPLTTNPLLHGTLPSDLRATSTSTNSNFLRTLMLWYETPVHDFETKVGLQGIIYLSEKGSAHEIKDEVAGE